MTGPCEDCRFSKNKQVVLVEEVIHVPPATKAATAVAAGAAIN
jgi:hypothetical protein